jgi:hypothetical protein
LPWWLGGLQECTEKVLDFLQSQPWVTSSYTLVYTDLDPYGQITLVRGKAHGAGQEQLTEHKKALRVTVAVQAVTPGEEQQLPQQQTCAEGDNAAVAAAAASSSFVLVDIWNVHLPAEQRAALGTSRRNTAAAAAGAGSSRRQGSAITSSSRLPPLNRTQQLARIAELVCKQRRMAAGRSGAGAGTSRFHTDDDDGGGSDDGSSDGDDGDGSSRGAPGWAIVGGDFNASKARAADLGLFRAVAGWVDVWSSVHGEDAAGWTFDPSRNVLAKHNSSSGMAARYDRILLSGTGLQVGLVQGGVLRGLGVVVGGWWNGVSVILYLACLMTSYLCVLALDVYGEG